MADSSGTRLTETGRLEAFSDGVFAIAITLIVLDLRPPDGDFATGLLAEGPVYLAYLLAFVTIGSIWLSHHDAFSRIRRVDAPALVLNLLLLLGASLVPWPTALLTTALGERAGHAGDAVAAVLVYSVVTVLIGLPWALLSGHLARRPALLESPADAAWMRRHALQSLSTLLVAAAGAALAFVTPIASLLLFIAVPVLFVVLLVVRSSRPRRAPA